MANYRYTIEGTKVIRTWNDGQSETFDTADLPDNVIKEYLVPLAVKERLGTGGILASQTDSSYATQRKLAADEWQSLIDGNIPSSRGGGWIPPTMDQLINALREVFGPEADAESEAITERVKAIHPDEVTDEDEAKKRKAQLKKDIIGSEELQAALESVGYHPPKPKKVTSSLLKPIE